MATLINNMECFPYEESLCRLLLFLLEKNQSRGHMMEISKIMKKSKRVNGEQLLTLSSSTGIGDIKWTKQVQIQNNKRIFTECAVNSLLQDCLLAGVLRSAMHILGRGIHLQTVTYENNFSGLESSWTANQVAALPVVLEKCYHLFAGF